MDKLGVEQLNESDIERHIINFSKASKMLDKAMGNFEPKCNFITCRYNISHRCTSEVDRGICVEVAERVLCVEDK